MSLPEFAAWQEFYMRYPFDDYHRFHRPAAMVAVALGGGSLMDRLDWLQPERAGDELTDADRVTMQAFGYRKKGG